MSHPADNTLSRLITKAAALFGGVQVVSILCSVIRTKVVAVLLGSVGIGVIGLYNSAIETITALPDWVFAAVRYAKFRKPAIMPTLGSCRVLLPSCAGGRGLSDCWEQ